MSLIGSAFLRQHVVEFIRGVGVRTDGVVDATSTNGPWTWTVPAGVSQLILDGCGAGGGGGGGTATGTSLGGGGGGASGIQFSQVQVLAAPGSSLTITVGAGGPGGVATNSTFAAATSGGSSLIQGLIGPAILFASGAGSVSTELRLRGGGYGQANGSIVGGGGPSAGWYPFANGSSGAGAPAAVAPSGSKNAQFGTFPISGGTVCASGGGGGGGSSTSGGTNGGSGGDHSDSGGYLYVANYGYSGGAGAGNNNGTQSRGGGGAGGMSIFANYPKGADGGSAAVTPSGYGAGGPGGGGGADGAAGCDGFIRFTYWSAD